MFFRFDVLLSARTVILRTSISPCDDSMRIDHSFLALETPRRISCNFEKFRITHPPAVGHHLGLQWPKLESPVVDKRRRDLRSGRSRWITVTLETCIHGLTHALSVLPVPNGSWRWYELIILLKESGPFSSPIPPVQPCLSPDSTSEFYVLPSPDSGVLIRATMSHLVRAERQSSRLSSFTLVKSQTQ